MGVLVQSGIAGAAGLLFAFGSSFLLVGSLAFFMLPVFRAEGVESDKRKGCNSSLVNARALIVIAVFYAVALGPLVLAALDYTSSLGFSVGSYLFVWFINVAVMSGMVLVGHVLGQVGCRGCGSRVGGVRTARCVAVCCGVMLLAIPPLSALSVVSPLPIAGLLFPGFGWLGVVLMLGVIALLVSGLFRTALITLIFLSGVAHATLEPVGHPAIHTNITDVSTTVGMPPALNNLDELRIARFEQLEQAEQLPAQVIVFPEGAFGEWHPLSQSILSQSIVHTNPRRILGGARVMVGHGAYVNVLMDTSTGTIVAAQNHPIPNGLPGTAFKGLRLNDRLSAVSGKDLVQTGEFAVVFCNEITNVFRSLEVFSTTQPVVLWVANFGWTEREFLVNRVQRNAEMWARLFNKPLVVAVNRHG